MSSANQTQAFTFVMEPVLPGRHAVITVAGADEATRVYARAVRAGDAGRPGDDSIEMGPPQPWPVVAREGECLTLDPPAGPHAVFALSLTPDAAPARPWFINRPRLDWSYPDEPAPGGELRLIGRQMISPDAYDGPRDGLPAGGARLIERSLPRVLARLKAGGPWIELPVRRASVYEAFVGLPATLKTGDYELFAHNGLGGAAGWSDPMPLNVRAAEVWRADVFDVEALRRDGESDDDAIARAIGAAGTRGGGVILLGHRRYHVRQSIRMPRFTTLRGQGEARTELCAPSAGSGVEPWTMVTGDSDFAVEDLRITGFCATSLICAPTFLPASFDEAMAIGFNWSPVRAHNVFVRRCRLVQRINFNFWRRRKDRAFMEWMHKHLDSGHVNSFSAIRLRGDRMEISGCTVLGGGTAVLLHGCTRVRVADNHLRAGPGGVGMHAQSKLIWPEKPAPGEPRGAAVLGNYSRFLLVENNRVEPWSERGRGGIFFWFGGEDCHAARNIVTDLWQCYDCEAVGTHLWMARWKEPRLEMLTDTTGRIIDPTGEVTHEILDGGAVEIVDGRGIGQCRRILRRDGDVIELDRPWHALADATSQFAFTAPPPFERIAFVDNTIQRTGSNITFWGCNRDSVADGNRLGEGQGLQIWTVRLAPDQKVWGGAAFISVINNLYRTGFAQPSPEDPVGSTYGQGVISTPCTVDDDAPTDGYDYLGLIIRNNTTEDQSGIVLKGHWRRGDWTQKMAGIVIESNTARDSFFGVLMDDNIRATLRHNVSESVERPHWVVHLPVSSTHA